MDGLEWEKVQDHSEVNIKDSIWIDLLNVLGRIFMKNDENQEGDRENKGWLRWMEWKVAAGYKVLVSS